MQQPATLAGEAHWLCFRCAGVGATLRKEGSLEPVRHCLHLFAMELERWGAEDVPSGWSSPFWLSRVRARLADGHYRTACGCARCQLSAVADDPEPVLHQRFGVELSSYADDLPVSMLRGMPENHELSASDGSTWRAVDEIARRLVRNFYETQAPDGKHGALSDRARPVYSGAWFREEFAARDVFGENDPETQRERDEKAKRYWRGLRKFGGGYPDGDAWVDPDGVVHGGEP